MTKRESSVTLRINDDEDEDNGAPLRKKVNSNNVFDFTSKVSPQSMASTMLKTLPENATTKHVETKQLFELYERSFAMLKSSVEQSFALLKSTIEQRTSEILGKIIATFSDDVLIVIFSFLRPCDLVHGVSLVSKKWLTISRSPGAWHPHDTLKFHVTTLESLRKLLNRKEFSNVKRLNIPKLTYGSIDATAEMCTAIEEIEVHFQRSTSIQLPVVFPNLSKLHLHSEIRSGGWDIQHVRDLMNQQDWLSFWEMIGTGLVELSIKGPSFRAAFDCDNCLRAIGQCCKKLERLWLCFPGCKVSQNGLMTLVQDCPRINSLSFIDTGVDHRIYSRLVQNAANLRHLTVVEYSDSKRKQIIERCSLAGGDKIKIDCISIDKYTGNTYYNNKKRRRNKRDGGFYVGQKWYSF